MVRRSPGAGRLIEGIEDHISDLVLLCRYPEGANELRLLSLPLPSLGDKQLPQR